MMYNTSVRLNVSGSIRTNVATLKYNECQKQVDNLSLSVRVALGVREPTFI